MAKKKVLIIIEDLGIGGVQKSLLALLQCLDYSKYDVDLMPFHDGGSLLPLVPSQVKIIDTPFPKAYLSFCPFAVLKMLFSFHFVAALWRFVSMVVGRFDNCLGTEATCMGMKALEKHYDVAIDYNGQLMLYYLVKKVNADKKISYFHSDYKKWRHFEKSDRRYYKYVDAIVTVSDECVRSMKEIFPEYSDKIYCIENIICKKTICGFDLSNPFEDDGFVHIVTVCRVVYSKGFDLAAMALEKLLNEGYKVKWYFVGPDDEKSFINSVLTKFDTKSCLITCGSVINPYRYMANADIVVLPSRFEGKSVTVEEAKIMAKPIVITSYSTASDQIADNVNGLIVPITADGVYQGIKKFIDDPDLKERFCDYLKKNNIGNQDEVEKFYSIID